MKNQIRKFPLNFDTSFLTKVLDPKGFDRILLDYAAAPSNGLIIQHGNSMHVCSCERMHGGRDKKGYHIELKVSFESHARDMNFDEKVYVCMHDYPHGLMLSAKTVKTKKKGNLTEYRITLTGKMNAHS